ncbi:DNA-directed RNA polymerase III subunit C31 [Exophiala xenobiotica]|nr:DNA-directed RNA polymerase III subunit C31 [Exophiala xenobiotica]KAK5549901.1 DNA-directed RNA polymerase III subunit C31 [Chaetothyriales sp. CCFEE 6169]KAK5279079.1 DNA-directed RNA polymerase III subunit C31 [Exophiala xenobiotica]KAK5342805.1 DNA-directed RNA polymerase III subunit C31 [Exophiala xenobiotica]KAK5372279.1 DNA-directed RNA polymerase III subunit C31 [Exophiala xenobiotica]
MSRGGRGGGKRGPDLSWDDEESLDTPSVSNKPQETFPTRYRAEANRRLQKPIDIPVPRPISSDEALALKSHRDFRKRVRNGPYYSVLDPSSVADEKTGKVLKRAGFDPFNDQEKYTAKYHKKKRAVPDLTGRDYALRYFPHELWPMLDPRRKNPLWKTTDIDFDTETNAPRKNLKRKRAIIVDDAEDDDEARANDEGNDTDASDPLLSGTRRSRNSTKAAKRRREDPTTKKTGEKRGLDAEDEFSDEEITPKSPRGKKNKDKGSDDEDDDDDDVDEHHDNDNPDATDEDDESGDDEPVDSEFEESDDGDGDDYNAENYFDTGEGDEDDYGAGGDDEGGTF